ncbi:MAG: 50S ribosomal protein L32 [Actinobacteria bacterium]|nr:50S ribosomal protein L32 [Actinomycetota bacterium]
MGVPKRKTSKSRRDKRRTHDRLKIVNIVECPRCHSKKISHRVCENCGYYSEHEIIIFEEKGKKKEKKETKEASK